jgi:hypothetical protein
MSSGPAGALITPYLAHQPGRGKGLTGMPDKVFQQPELGQGQLEAVACQRCDVAGRVKDQVAGRREPAASVTGSTSTRTPARMRGPIAGSPHSGHLYQRCPLTNGARHGSAVESGAAAGWP